MHACLRAEVGASPHSYGPLMRSPGYPRGSQCVVVQGRGGGMRAVRIAHGVPSAHACMPTGRVRRRAMLGRCAHACMPMHTAGRCLRKRTSYLGGDDSYGEERSATPSRCVSWRPNHEHPKPNRWGSLASMTRGPTGHADTAHGIGRRLVCAAANGGDLCAGRAMHMLISGRATAWAG